MNLLKLVKVEFFLAIEKNSKTKFSAAISI
jgi:hypothetical protein